MNTIGRVLINGSICFIKIFNPDGNEGGNATTSNRRETDECPIP